MKGANLLIDTKEVNQEVHLALAQEVLLPLEVGLEAEAGVEVDVATLQVKEVLHLVVQEATQEATQEIAGIPRDHQEDIEDHMTLEVGLGIDREIEENLDTEAVHDQEINIAVHEVETDTAAGKEGTDLDQEATPDKEVNIEAALEVILEDTRNLEAREVGEVDQIGESIQIVRSGEDIEVVQVKIEAYQEEGIESANIEENIEVSVQATAPTVIDAVTVEV